MPITRMQYSAQKSAGQAKALSKSAKKKSPKKK